MIYIFPEKARSWATIQVELEEMQVKFMKYLRKIDSMH